MTNLNINITTMALFPFLEEELKGDVLDIITSAEIALFTFREIFNLSI